MEIEEKREGNLSMCMYNELLPARSFPIFTRIQFRDGLPANSRDSRDCILILTVCEIARRRGSFSDIRAPGDDAPRGSHDGCTKDDDGQSA